MESQESEYPDPEEELSRAIDPTMWKEEPGVYRDTLADAVADCASAHRLLSDMYVTLDGILDDKGLYPDEIHRNGREVQQEIQNLSQWTEEYREALKAEYEEALKVKVEEAEEED